MIPVSRPFLPDKTRYSKYVDEIWGRNWLTNNGPIVNELEDALKKHLNVKNISFVSNGTIAIQIAIKALALKGEIITTPFSYVATSSSIVWEGCKPIYADIDPNSLNINPDTIQNLITPHTSAILATHVYGNPCEVEKIEKIAIENNLKVIYDAAHCFGVKYNDKSLYSFGDISTASFHATKLFHTIEGGALFCQDDLLMKSISYLRNFGHDGPEKFASVGINGKNSEFHAAMGLCMIDQVDNLIEERKKIVERYKSNLENLRKKDIQINAHCTRYNYAYYPIILESESVLLKHFERLNANYVMPRRYFYPSLSALPYVSKQPTPISDDVSCRVLCLPLYNGLSMEEVDYICKIMLETQRHYL